MPNAPHDPYENFNFRVEIDGVAVAAFSEVTGLAATTDVIEYRTGDMKGGTRKLPGRTKFENITLERGVTQDTTFWNWYRTVLDGRPDRKNGAIVLLDDAFEEVARWRFRNAWPCKYVGPALNAKGNCVAIETLELAHEGLDLAAG
jgi:phage tail-like protein